MQLIQSELSSDKYLSHIKSSFSSPFNFFCERFTGFCLGNFFYVTHHCDHQWDRKYNSPKNAAFARVVATESGCDIYFLTFKGLLCPSQFLLLLTLLILFPLFACIATTSALTIYKEPLFWIGMTAFSVISAAIATLFESLSERSTEGENALLSLLYNPENPY